MKGDFSRNTFDRQHRFSRVLMQQGRVLLDADWNEQTSILLHTLRTLAADLIGPHGGPGNGFEIRCTDDKNQKILCDFIIGRGHYYVDGILCENTPSIGCRIGAESPVPLTYSSQPDYPLPKNPLTGRNNLKLKKNTRYLVYLHVWERHMTPLEADHIREVALGGPDTATRAKIVWQVKVAKEGKDTPANAECAELLAKLMQDGVRCLRARARVAEPSDDVCITPPEARFRGAENQLYRVEIHRGGAVGAKNGANFKFSRDNGSVAYAISSLQGSIATLDSLGPDDRRSLEEGDWVEIVHDPYVLRGEPGLLLKVEAVDRVGAQVTLAGPEGLSLPVFDENSTTHPLLRRWDQASDALPVQEAKWIDLEDGVQVYFEPGGSYRTGDHWLIPARTATGDVLWPAEETDKDATYPKALSPHGIEHHYAPLARLSVNAAGYVKCEVDCRRSFDPLCAAAEVPPPPKDDPREAQLAALRQIDEIGNRRSEKLLDAGFDTPRAVAGIPTEKIAELLAVSVEVAKKIKESAHRISEGGS